MTVIRNVHIACELGRPGCVVVFPDRPVRDGLAKDLRERARVAGWEAARHTKGRDVCPTCRIVEIREAAATPEVGVSVTQRAAELGIVDNGAL